MGAIYSGYHHVANLARTTFTALLLGAGCQAHHSYCQQKHYFLHISSWSVSSHSSGLCQDLLKLTVIQFHTDKLEFICSCFQTVRWAAIRLLGAICSHVRHPTAGQDFLFHRFECHTAGACLPARQCGHEAMQGIMGRYHRVTQQLPSAAETSFGSPSLHVRTQAKQPDCQNRLPAPSVGNHAVIESRQQE